MIQAGQWEAEQPQAEIRPMAQLGLVPTMGALHAGHLSLIRRARQETQIVVVSIFVNPLQFGPQEDLHRYPRELDRDRQLCDESGVDLIFAPTVDELYGQSSTESTNVTQVIPPKSMMSGLCGRCRPGHFEGVATVVTKLLNLVQPQRAYFGQKDAQQLIILHRLVADLNIPVEIVGCPIVREEDGLALSSRNQYLSDLERQQAPILYRSLQQAEAQFQSGTLAADHLIQTVHNELATAPLVEVEYVELVHPKTLEPLEQIEESGLLAIAARMGSTRLIDNRMLRARKPILAIDGPAGAGKSTVVRQVAHQLKLLYLDTGAMYRAVTWLVLQSNIDLNDEVAIAELVSQCDIQLASSSSNQSEPLQEDVKTVAPCRVWINRQEVTQAIRSLQVTNHVSTIAAQSAVRRELVQQQRRYGQKGGVIMEGRDIGTYVFPDADLKIFLTASVQERARRRQRDLQNQGEFQVELEELERAIYTRDQKDSTRAIAPLRKASDALEIQTDGLTIDEVTDTIVDLYQQRFLN